MKFVHTSDWQLGKPFGRAPDHARGALREARLDAIDAIGALAAREGAFVVVAGDVFDSPSPSDRAIGNAVSRMERQPSVRWYLLPGNHDPARAEGLWSRVAKLNARNVILLHERTSVEVQADLWILPAPLMHRRAAGDPTAWLDSAETPRGARRIGVAHGQVLEFGGVDVDAQSLISGGRAASARLDYLALGDRHIAHRIDARTHHSGTPEPDDHGATGSVNVVELGAPGEEPHVTAAPIARHSWLRRTWNVASLQDLRREASRLDLELKLTDLVLHLTLEGVVSIEARAEIFGHLEDVVSHQVRWLDVHGDGLICRPTDDDLGAIDAQGVLREAAERLKALAADAGVDAPLAQAALERLFREQVRVAGMGVDA
jgi:DNA repair exonuclease SbcCD nuclease subunit